MSSPFHRAQSATRPTRRLGVEALEDRTTPTAVTFDPHTVLSMAGTLPLGVDVADFTGDGKPDVVAGFLDGSTWPNSPAKFAVFPGVGDGTFGPAQVFDAGTGSGGGPVAVGDFNNDGHPDVVLTAGVSTDGGFGNRVSVNLGNGAGGFAAPIVFTTGGSDNFVRVADFNEDGNADLAIHTADAGQIAVHFGNGTGHFPAATQIPLASPTWGAANHQAVDLNGDGHTDIAVALSQGTNQVKVYYGTGTGAFTTGPVIGIPTGAVTGLVGLVTADLNEDGVMDLAAGVGTQVFVYRGTGGGAFAAPVAFPALPTGGEAGVMDVADFDGDGNADLAVSNNSQDVVAVLRGDGTGTFAAPETFTARQGSGYSQGFRAADLNGDGRPDLVATSHSNPQPGVTVLINWTAVSPPPPTNAAPTASAGGPYTITYGSGLTLNGAGSSDPDGDALTYSWTVNGHAAAAIGVNSSLTWAALTALGVTSAGAYTVALTVDDGHGHTVTSAAEAVTVNRAMPTVTVTGGSFVFDGQPHPATGSVIGVGGANLGTPAFTYSYTDDAGNVVTTTAEPVEPGYYMVTATFPGDANYTAAAATATLTIVCEARTLTDLSRAFNAGRTIPIKLQLVDAVGNNVSAAGIDLTALRVVRVNPDGSRTTVALQDAGNANLGNLFRYDAALGGYIFNLSTKNLGAGQYEFVWAAGIDPTEHVLGFRLS